MKLWAERSLQTMNKWPDKVRVLLFFVVMVVFFLVWKFLLWDRLQYKQTKLSQQTKQTYKEVQTLKEGLKEGQHNLLKHMSAAQKQTTNNNVYNRLVPAQEMTKVLEDLLFARHDLELLQLENLPVKAIPTSDPKQVVYEYGMIIKFRGNYFAALRYLDDLENLGWAFFWDKLTYKVANYPNAEVALQLHTLSDQKGWIHV
jgi:MSHA biogenesis protein MshJ